MPQLDSLSYIHQIIWQSFIFLILIILFKNYILLILNQRFKTKIIFYKYLFKSFDNKFKNDKKNFSSIFINLKILSNSLENDNKYLYNTLKKNQLQKCFINK